MTAKQIVAELEAMTSTKQAAEFFARQHFSKKELVEIAEAGTVIVKTRESARVITDAIINTLVAAPLKYKALMEVDLEYYK